MHRCRPTFDPGLVEEVGRDREREMSRKDLSSDRFNCGGKYSPQRGLMSFHCKWGKGPGQPLPLKIRSTHARPGLHFLSLTFQQFLHLKIRSMPLSLYLLRFLGALHFTLPSSTYCFQLFREKRTRRCRAEFIETSANI